MISFHFFDILTSSVLKHPPVDSSSQKHVVAKHGSSPDIFLDFTVHHMKNARRIEEVHVCMNMCSIILWPVFP